MKVKRILANTNMFIGLLEEVAPLIEFYDLNFCYSVMSRIELLSKPDLSKNDEDEVYRMLESAALLTFNDDIELRTISIRRRHCSKLPDAIIAATAIYYGLTLVTFDKGFSGIAGLDVIIIPYPS